MKQINKRFVFDNEKKEMVIFIKPSPLFTRIILSIVIGISISIPILVTAFAIYSRAELKIGLFFSYFLFFGIGFYLLRVFLWNCYGKEVIIFNKENIKYYADYKYFKDGRQTIKNVNLDIYFSEFTEGSEKKGILIIENEKEKITSCIKLPKKEVKLIVDKINSDYKSKI